MAFASGRPNWHKDDARIIRTNANYAGECGELLEMGKLPAGLIDKENCGCGLTSFAIENENGNVVIAMPTIDLVNNKESQYPNERYRDKLLGVIGGVGSKDIDSYIAECEAKGRNWKIMVTYDSLPKLRGLLDKAHLVVDEWQMINFWAELKSCSADRYRNGKLKRDTMTEVLRIAKEYKDRVTFLTATPLDLDFMPEWVYELDQTFIKWNSLPTGGPLYTIKAEGCSPIQFVKESLINVIQKKGVVRVGEYECRKLIIFVNAIKSAVDMSKGVPIEDCAIVCSDKEENDLRIRGSIRRLNNSEIGNLPKYTFVTSSGWQGIDLYDTEAVNVAVSFMPDNENDVILHTLIDPTVQLKQIFGRQRNKENKSYQGGIFVYDTWSVDVLNREKAKLEAERERVINNIKSLEKEEGDLKESLNETFMESHLFRTYVNPNEIGDNLEFNTMLYACKSYKVNRILEAYVNIRMDERGVRVYRRDAIAVDCEGFKRIRDSRLSWNVISNKYYNELKGLEIEWAEGQQNTNEYRVICAFYELFGVDYGQPPKKLKEAEELIEEYNNRAFYLECRIVFNYEKEYTSTELAELFNDVACRLEIDKEYNPISAGRVLKRVFTAEDNYRINNRLLNGITHYKVELEQQGGIL